MTLSIAEIVSFVFASALLWAIWFYVGRYVGTHNATKEEQRLRADAAADEAAARVYLQRATENLAKAEENLKVRREEIFKEINDRLVADYNSRVHQLQTSNAMEADRVVQQRVELQRRRIESLDDYQFRAEASPADAIASIQPLPGGGQETEPEQFGRIYQGLLSEHAPILRITPGEDTYRIEITLHVVDEENPPREICVAYMRRSRARLGNVLEHMFPYQSRRRNHVPEPPVIVAEASTRNIDLS